MATDIQWTDETWNPVTGCSKVSPGCAHCYAERVAIRLWASQYPPIEIPYAQRPVVNECPELDPDCQSNDDECHDGCEGPTRPRAFTDVQCHEDRLDQPLRWKKPRKVFVNSMSDLFHEDVPDAFIDRVLAIAAWTPWHTYQVLTKRADRMRQYFAEPWHRRVSEVYRAMRDRTPRKKLIAVDDTKQRAQGWAFGSITCGDHASRFLPNVWLGVSVENQHFADERIPLLLQTPAAVRFISAEPLLGPVSLKGHMPKPMFYCAGCGNEKFRPYCSPCQRDLETVTNQIAGLDWVIVGGESGAGARPFDVAWARSIVAQCQAAGVPVFVKQLGAKPVHERSTEIGSALMLWTLRDRKGGDMAEWPENLRVRQMPAVPA